MPGYGKALYQLSEKPVFLKVTLILAIIWLVFAVHMFEINPGFFGVTGLLAIGWIFILTKRELIVTDKGLLIRNKHLLAFYTRKHFYPYGNTASIKYQSHDLNAFDVATIFFPGASTADRPPEIFLNLKDGTFLRFHAPT